MPQHTVHRYRTSYDPEGWSEFECWKCGIDMDEAFDHFRTLSTVSCPSCHAEGVVVLGPVMDLGKPVQ